VRCTTKQPTDRTFQQLSQSLWLRIVHSGDYIWRYALLVPHRRKKDTIKETSNALLFDDFIRS